MLPLAKAAIELLSHFSRVRLCATPRRQPTRLPVPAILQARTLEQVAISFSNAWKWKVKSECEVAQSYPTLRDPMDCSPPGSSIGFSRQEYWCGVPLPSPYRAKEVQNLELEPCLINETLGAAEVEAARKLQLQNPNYWRGKIEFCLVRSLFLK